MTDLPTLVDETRTTGHETFDQARQQLVRMWWMTRAMVLIIAGLWGIYQILLVRMPSQDVGLYSFVTIILGLALVEFCFRFILRYQDKVIADRQRLAAAAIAKEKLLQETQEKLVETAQLVEVSQAIGSMLTLDELLPYLADSLMRFSSGTGCFIVLRDPYTGELQPSASCGSFAKEPTESLVDDYTDLIRAAIKTGEPVIVQNVDSNPYITSQNLEHRSLLGFPLSVQGRPIGSAVVGHMNEGHLFSGSEDRVGRTVVVSNQGAIAIANAKMFREVERRLVELGTLAEISRVIGSLLTPSEIYEKLVNELARAFGYPFVAFYRLEDDRTLNLGAQIGYAPDQLPSELPYGEGLIGQAAQRGQIAYVPDVTDVDSSSHQHWKAHNVVSQIVIPFRKDENVLGVLSVESDEPLTEADLSLLQSVSYQAGMAIENARLYAAEQREREIARTLLQVAGDLSGTLELDKVINLILERLRPVVPYETAAIGLLSGDAYYLAAAQNLERAQRLWGTRLVPDTLPLVDRVVQDRCVIVLPDTSTSEEWVMAEGVERIRSWLGVPLVVKDQAIGLLMLNHPVPNFYDEESGRLALAFAQHAAVAIENARLYKEAKTKLREQTILYEMSTDVSSTLRAPPILRLLAERLVMALDVTGARIATVDDQLQTATFVAQHYVHPKRKADQKVSPDDTYKLDPYPETLRALKERRPLLVTAQEESDEWRTRMTQEAGQAMLLLPLVARDRVIGFAELWESLEKREFNQAEVALAQALINQAAVAVDNARLFAETKSRLEELTLLYDMAVVAASTLDIDTTLRSVVKTLQFRVLEDAMVNVWLLDEQEQHLQLYAHAGQVAGMDFDSSQLLSQEICHQVLKKSEPVLIRDTHQDTRHAGYGSVCRSILCVPLAWGQRVIGVLGILSIRKDAFSDHDRRFLRTLAGSLAIAVENGRLFTKLKHSEEALTLRNQALKEANDRLKELDRLKSTFIASVSHELRTPLNSIIGFSEVLIDGLAGDLTPLAQEYLDYIHSNGKHLLNLINDILDLSKLQTGRMSLELDPVDVLALAEEVQATLSPMVLEKGQTLEIEQDGTMPEIIADPFRLRQILFNLVGNAVKFTPEGGRITVQTYLRDSDTVCIDVADNGPGIPQEDQELIFEEFRQARTTGPQKEGTGLGLAISRRLVELHQGSLTVQSQPGVGATFTIQLPVSGPATDEGGEKEEHYEVRQK
jgi:signal transduction histidine kinase